MEHVLFVIIYAATLNSHKLFGLVSFIYGLMTKTKGSCSRNAAATYVYTSTCMGSLKDLLPIQKSLWDVEAGGSIKTDMTD